MKCNNAWIVEIVGQMGCHTDNKINNSVNQSLLSYAYRNTNI